MSRKIKLILLLVALIPTSSFADNTAIKAKYDQLCASCHGLAGAGDGPVALSLPEGSKPNNLQTGVMKFATDETKFKELLRKGGAGVGLNPLMPPQTSLTEEEMSAMYALVVSFKK